MIELDIFSPADGWAVETLLDKAFGPDRHMKTSQRLRDGRLPADGLAFVARDGDTVIGTISFWHVDAGGRQALLLGPVAVDCAYQGQGVGRSLIINGLNQAATRGHGGVILVGDAPYYGRFGFERRHTCGLVLPGPVDEKRFLGMELMPGALEGAHGLVVPTGMSATPTLPALAPFDFVPFDLKTAA